MRGAWHQISGWLTPGVCLVLGLLSVSCLAAFTGTLSAAYNLSALLGLNGPAFWHGRVGLGITYVLVPAGVLDFLLNASMIAWLGSFLERAWSRREFWSYCLIVIVSGGLVKVCLQPFSAGLLTGATPLVFGLLAARVRLCGTEIGSLGLGFLPAMSRRRMFLLVAAINFLLLVAGAGLLNATIMLGGGEVGWLCLSLRWKVNLARCSRPVTSERMSRL